MYVEKILQAMIFSGSKLIQCDAIEFERKLWLVPEWCDNEVEKKTWPARLIRFDNLPHQRSEGGQADYMVNTPIPEEVLSGKTSKGFEVLQNPNIKFDIHSVH